MLKEQQRIADLAAGLQSLLGDVERVMLLSPDLARSEFHFHESGRELNLSYTRLVREFAELFGAEARDKLTADFLPHYAGLKETGEKLYRYIKSEKRHRRLKRRTPTRQLDLADDPTHIGLDAWAGGEEATLAIVFTDIVGSTSLSAAWGDALMAEVRQHHYDKTRAALAVQQGCEVKTLGDGFLLAFRTAGQALGFAQSLLKDTGHEALNVRIGVHVGPVNISEGDVFGTAVDVASRICDRAAGGQIWMSDRAREDILATRPDVARRLAWQQHSDCLLKGYVDAFLLWSLESTARPAY